MATEMTPGGPSHADGAPKGRRRRRLLIGLGLALAVLVLVVLLAPTILSSGVFLRYALGAAGDYAALRVSADGWNLSWFGGQEVRGLSVETPGGDRVARAERVALEQGLLALLRDRSRIGEVRVDGAEVWTDGLAKAMDVLAARPPKPPTPKEAQPEPPPTIPQAVVIRNLTVRARAATLSITDARFENAADNDRLQNFEAAWKLEHGAKPGAGSVQGTIEGLRQGWRGWDALGASATVKGRDLPLDALSAMAADLGVAVEAGGRLSADAAVSRSRTGDIAVQAVCDGADLWVTGKALSGDRPALDTLHLRIDARYAGRALAVSAFELDCPVATAKANGTFALAVLDTTLAGKALTGVKLQVAPPGKARAEVQLQVAPLARMLPHTLGLHKDVVIEGGSVEGSIEMTSDEKVSTLKVTADVKDLRGRRGDQAIALMPGRLVLDVEQDRQAPKAPTAGEPSALAALQTLRVKTLSVTGAFGTVRASGRMESFTLDAQLDLAKATEDVARFVDLGDYAARGTATAGIQTEGSLESGIRLAAQSDFRDLEIVLSKGRRWTEPHAALALAGNLTFDAKRDLAAASLESLTLDAATARLAARGDASRGEGPWTFRAAVRSDGDVLRAANLASVLADLLAPPAAPKKGAAPAARDWRQMIAEVAARLAGAGGQGAWRLEGNVEGAAEKFIGAKGIVTVTDVVVPAAATAGGAPAAASASASRPAAGPVRIEAASAAGQVRYDYGEAPRITVTGLEAKVPGLAANVSGTMTLAAAQGAADSQTKGEARAAVDLAALSETLRPFGILPDDPKAAGSLTVQLAAASEANRRTTLTVSVDGQQVDVRWADGRRLTEPRVAVKADAALTRDAAGDLAQVDVAQWSVQAAAGALGGTAGATRKAKAWAYRATAAGEGSVEPLARTVAGLLGRPPNPIRGQWKLKGEYQVEADGTSTADLAASATNLAIPQTGEPPRPDVRLADVRLDTSAALAADGRIQVRRANLTGPGLTVAASGTARLPSEADKNFAADGAVKLKADLAALAQTLAPFGVLAPESRLAGTADFDGKVATGAAGVTGSGTLDLASLDVALAEAQVALREPQVHLPLTFAHVPRDRRWEVAIDGMRSGLLSGSLKGSFAEGDRAARLDAQCDLECDGARLRDLLGKRLAPEWRLAGAWKVKARAAGPVPNDGAWNQRIAGLAGDGSVDLGRFEYKTITGGAGAVRWRMAGGRILLNPEPARPSRFGVAGGAVNLGGRIDLVGPVARLVIAERLALVDKVPLEGDELRAYLKYASPVVAASVNARGRLSVVIDTLDVPLAEGAAEKAAATGAYWIDEFQTDLAGVLGGLVRGAGGRTQTPVQRLGPIAVRMADGTIHIAEHELLYTDNTRLRFGGSVHVNGQMNVMVGMPMTEHLLTRFGASKTALPYLQDQIIAVPLTGTVDNPRLDEKAIGKRVGEMAVEAIKRRALEEIGNWLKRGGK